MYHRSAAIGFLTTATISAGATLSAEVISPSVYDSNTAAMNAVLGIGAGYSVVDFDTSWAASGLSIDVGEGAGSGTVQTPGASLVWDGTDVLANVANGQDGHDVDFFFDGGASRVGFGLSHLERSLEILVMLEGSEEFVSLGAVENYDNFQPATSGRNGYLWINASGGKRIDTVRFNTVKTNRDLILFDHVAWVPTPSVASVLILSGGFAVQRRRR